MDGRIRLAVNGGGPGRTIDIAYAPTRRPRSTVSARSTTWRWRSARPTNSCVCARNCWRTAASVTEVRDRCYFQSIYFREPGGVLFEVATLQPGFAIDETPASLGRALKLPPWEEANRPDIEAHLVEVKY